METIEQSRVPTAMPPSIMVAEKKPRNDLFPATARMVKLGPVNAIENSQAMTFCFTPNANEVVFPHRLRIVNQFQVVSGDNNARIDIKDAVIPVNGLSHAFFKSCNVKLGQGYLITKNDSLYAHRGDMENKLKLTYEQKINAHSSQKGWDQEEVDFSTIRKDDLPLPLNPDEQKDEEKVAKFKKLTEKYPTYFRRNQKIHDGNMWEETSPIFADICQQEKPFLPGVKVQFIFQMQDNQRLLILGTENDAAKFKVRLVSSYLLVQYEPMPQEFLDRGIPSTFTYNTTRVEMNNETRPGGSSMINIPNPIPGNRLPRRVTMCMIKESAFHGHTKQDPFWYTDFNVDSVALRVSGQNKPMPVLYMNRYDGDCGQPLFALQKAWGWEDSIFHRGITLKNFKKGNCLFSWNFAGNEEQPGQTTEVPKWENINIEVKFKDSLDEAVTILTMIEYDQEILCDLIEGKFTPHDL